MSMPAAGSAHRGAPCRSGEGGGSGGVSFKNGTDKNTETTQRLLSSNSDGGGATRAQPPPPDAARGRLLAFCRQRLLIVCFVALLGVCVASLAMAAFAVHKYSELVSELRIARENRGKLCLECSSHATIREMWSSDRHGECCIQLEDLLDIVQKVGAKEVESQLRKVPSVMSAGIESNSSSGSAAGSPVYGHAQHRPTAHLIANAQVPITGSGQGRGSSSGQGAGIDGVMIANWDLTARSSHVTQPLSYNGGYLTVQDNGYYFVYSQVSVADVFDSPLAETSTEALSHSIWRRRFSRSGGEPAQDGLLRSRKSKNWPAGSSYGLETSYVGGVVYLEKGDELFVRVSGARKLFEDSTTSFFGLMTL